MLDLGFSYQDCVEKSDEVLWKIDDLLIEGAHLDLDRPLPFPHGAIEVVVAPEDRDEAVEVLRLASIARVRKAHRREEEEQIEQG